MVETLSLHGDERVLEVGTGYGWQTGLLAGLAREVFKRRALRRPRRDRTGGPRGRENVTVVVDNGSEGCLSTPDGKFLGLSEQRVEAAELRDMPRERPDASTFSKIELASHKVRTTDSLGRAGAS